MKQAAYSNTAGGLRSLKLNVVHVYGIEINAIVDTGSVPYLMSWDFCQKLSLSPQATNRQFTVAHGTVSQVFDCVEKAPVSCGAIVNHIDFLVSRNALFDSIVQRTTLKSLRANFNYKRQEVTLFVEDKEVLLLLP